MRKIFLLTYIILLIVSLSARGQSNYPVYVTPSLTPPYTLKLSDYSAMGSQKLMVTIYVNDLNISNMPVKLRIKMETMGVTIENPPTITTTPVFVNGGETKIIFGKELADYFNINKLIFKGYSKETYKRTGQLPEGFYKFTVEVLHFNTNRLISNLGSAAAWISLGKPPILKLPEDNAQMGQFRGMPLSFTWLASNVGSPVSVATIQYKFEMWEMHVPGINPNIVALSMPVFHEHTNSNTVYTLYPVSLDMKPGMRYAWRVTASDMGGFVPFEQNGHSEIRTFIYKALCDSISGLTGSHKGRNAVFSWEPEGNHTSFNIEMRNPKTGWSTNSESFENKAEFFGLEYGSAYEMRVQAVCDSDPDSKSDFSAWKRIAIPVPQPVDTADCPDCVCDSDIPNVELKNFNLRNGLQPGDTIENKTGTTRFIIKTVEPQGGGTYKGVFLFWAELWKFKVVCNYWDLQVNTDNVIVNMDFESVYDPQYMLNIDTISDYLNNLGDAITTLTSDTHINDTLVVNETITSIYVNDSDSVIVVTVDEEGNINEEVIHTDVDELEKILIEGENGEEYVVTRDGQVMGVDEYKNTGGGRSNLVDKYNKEKEENRLAGIEVGFTAHAGQKYGFDAYNEQKPALQNDYPTLNNGYHPAYKSIASFKTDLVGISNSGDNIIFKDEMGIPALKTGEDLTLRGSANGSGVALYAYQRVNDTTEKIAGKLNIMSFDEQFKKLYIVSVNGAKLPDEKELQQTLNKVYAQAITNWEVIMLEGLPEITFENGQYMAHGGSSAISVYNKDQRSIVNAFVNSGQQLESGAFYLFFVENVQFKERSIAGYMPLQRQVGFIYDYPGLNIIAHELGHGAFNLQHTFSPGRFLATEHTTDNLMDYKGSTELWKHQWKEAQNPQTILFAFTQDEEEGEAISTDTATIGTWAEIFPESNDSALAIISRIYDTVSVNFDKYHDASISNNVKLNETDLATWSVRKSSHTGEKGKVGLLAKTIATSNTPNYSTVDANEIYIKKYEYNATFDSLEFTTNTKIALYSYVDVINFSKPTITNLNELANIDTIKIASFKFKHNSTSEGYIAPISPNGNLSTDEKYSTLPQYRIDDYVIIAFYSDGAGNPDFVFQLIPDEDSRKDYEVATWLKHLNILQESSSDTLDDGTKLGDPVPNPVITAIAGDTLKGKMGCVRTSRNNCDNSYSNYTTNTYDDEVRIQKHTGIDITADVGTNIHAIYGGRVYAVVSSFDLRNETYFQEPTLDVQGNNSWERIQGNIDTIGNYNYYSIISYETEDDTINNLAIKRGFYGCHYVGKTITGTDKTALGNYVIIETTNFAGDTINTINGTKVNTLYITYAHMNEVKVTKGQIVPRGGIIGTSGCSGNAARIVPERYHIHIQAGDSPWSKNIDPINLLNTQLE